MNKLRTVFFAFAALALTIAPNVASARVSTFYGIAKHVSMNNIKVYNPRTHQTLSFMILPKFDRIFSANGKTTFQMKDVKPGRYVGIIYDQSVLGIRHADKVYLLTSENEKISSQ